MNRRGRRLMFMVAVMGLVVLIGLGALYWGTVRDHVEAWNFQLTRNTRTIQPLPEGYARFTWGGPHDYEELLLQDAANELRSSVIFDPQEVPFPVTHTMMMVGNTQFGSHEEIMELVTEALDIRVRLEKNGWRVLEQRLPRKAYVVIRDADPIEQAEPQPFTRFQPILWEGVYPRPERDRASDLPVKGLRLEVR